MKKLIALALTLVAANGAFAQGTVQFQNSVFSAINTNTTDLTARGRANSSMNLVAGLYWGTTAGNVTTLAGTETFNPASPGVLNGSTLFAINGAAPGSTVYLQVVVWDGGTGTGQATPGAMYGASGILPFTLGAASGPGAVLFGSGTTAGVFHSFDVVPTVTPEPSTIALAGLGAASLLLFRRRK